MPVIQPRPKELLVVKYELTGYANETTGNGEGLFLINMTTPQPFGGTFTSGNLPVEVEVVIPVHGYSLGSAGWSEVYVVLDGSTLIGKAFRQSTGANASIGREYLRNRLTGLSAGAHTIAVQLKVSSATAPAYVSAETTNPAYIIVREYVP